MGIFSKENRATYKLSGTWEKLWASPSRVADPRSDLTPLVAFNNLGDVAGLSNATSGDALVVAVDIITEVDRANSYPGAIEGLRERYRGGSLRSIRDEPMSRRLPWNSLIEIAELATLMARPVKVQGWRNEVLAAYGRGESPDSALQALLDIAPHSTMDAYSFWKGNLEKWRAMAAEERDEVHDYDDAVSWASNVIKGIDRLTSL